MSGIELRQSILARIYDRIDHDFPEHLERCRTFLRQKSVSATGEGIRETAQQVKSFIEEVGGTAAFWGNPDFPIVWGRIEGNADKTLIIYGMYDVQPADEPNWMSPPFEAAIHTMPNIGECVIARGAFNSKGVLCGLFNSLKALVETDKIPVNLIFVIEGEEEIGSLQIEEFIRTHRAELKADAAADFDFSQDSRGRVRMYLGLKGIVYMDLICRGGKKGGPAETSLHGADSAWLSSPAWRLVHALSSITDSEENIVIRGFCDNVAPPSTQDLELLEKLKTSFDEKTFLKEMKSMCFKCNREGIDLLVKGLYSPIININGFRTGYDGPGTKTLLPRKATAKVDIRFGPKMEPDEVVEKFKAHLLSTGFDDIEIRVRDSYTWSKTDFSEPVVQDILAAYRLLDVEPEIWPIATWTAPYFVFSRILGLPVVGGGLGHGGRAHAANEYMTVKGLKDFEKFFATFLHLAAVGSKGAAAAANGAH